jgi:predicted transcriptional regulator
MGSLSIRRIFRMATLVEIAGQLVAAHAAVNQLSTEELLLEIGKVHAALKNLENGTLLEETGEIKTPMTVKEAFRKHEVVCMICGKGGFRTLTRHLGTSHQLKPGAYRKQFDIPSGQALSARSYSESRRQMALDRGLGDNLAKARKVRMAGIEARKKAAARPEPAKAATKTMAPARAKAKARK